MQLKAPDWATVPKPILSPDALTLATLFSCGGLLDAGAMAAGIRPVLAVEFDPDNPRLSNAFADCYEQNIGAHVVRKPVQKIVWHKYDAPDILHASPSCKQFSVAKSGSKESSVDMECADAVCQALRQWRPKAFTLENVRAYACSKSWAMILRTLYELGYWVSSGVLNAADFGVPQTRMRFCCWAIRGQMAPSLLPATKWMGWHGVIADLLPDLPETQLAPWQQKRLPNLLQNILIGSNNSCFENPVTTYRHEDHCSFSVTGSSLGRVRAFLIDSKNTHPDNRTTVRQEKAPIFSVTAQLCDRPSHQPLAYLIERTGARSDRKLNCRESNEPSWTIRSAIGTDQNGNNRNETINALLPGEAAHESRHWWERGRVVRLDARALARLQSVPDWYELPPDIKHAGPLIGNGVPCLMAEGIMRVIANQIKDAL